MEFSWVEFSWVEFSWNHVPTDVYRLLLHDKKAGLSINLLANRVLPAILPLTVYPTLQIEHFNFILGTVYEMLDVIDK